MWQKLINLFWHLPVGILANIYYDFPGRKVKVIGVTGTSGKTSTSHLIYHLLERAGYKAALISSVGARIGRTMADTGLHVTNPDPWPLQRLLNQIAAKKYEYLVLEVTSHGLDQYRVWGIPFVYGVLTNITHEHLDYHKSFESYRQAKLKLIRRSSIAVLNQDDPAFKLAQAAAGGRVIGFSQGKNFITANFNAAAAVARDLGVGRQEILTARKSFPGVPGRMELVQEKPFKVVIDFAHKPDALAKALEWLRLKTKGRLIAVFGCAGLRDKSKRPLMGEIAGRLADVTILTAEDPRTEDVNEIIRQIKSGFKSKKKLYCQPDRQKAINLAVSLVRPGDTVVCLGKSHEKSMCFGTIEYPWSEHRAVLKALKLRKAGR